MNLKSWKTLFLSVAVTGAFILSVGLSNSANVYAQSARNDCPTSNQERVRREEILRNHGWDGRVDRNGNVDLNHNGVDDRCEADLFYGGRYGNDRYEDRAYRNYPYNNYPYNRGEYDNYGYNNYGYSTEEQRGYRDGLLRGRETALNNLRPDPSNSFRFQNGNNAYREGFRRGYWQAYRQYRDRYDY